MLAESPTTMSCKETEPNVEMKIGKPQYLGHVTRGNRLHMLHVIVQGNILGKHGRPIWCLRNLRKWFQPHLRRSPIRSGNNPRTVTVSSEENSSLRNRYNVPSSRFVIFCWYFLIFSYGPQLWVFQVSIKKRTEIYNVANNDALQLHQTFNRITVFFMQVKNTLF